MSLIDIINQFSPVSLSEIDAVQLQNRIDTKYILHCSKLTEFLNNIKGSYFVLSINDNRIFTYHTTYFDTASYQFYKDHHNGCINRIKVRCREYVESGMQVYEIKRKLYGTRTDKLRFHIEQHLESIPQELYKHIEYRRLNQQALEKKLTNTFHRITLVNYDFTERITIDYDISIANDKKEIPIKDIAIIEVKQYKNNAHSLTMLQLKAQKIYPINFSKYAIGVSLLEDNVKHNFFKPTLRIIQKIQNIQCPI